MKITRRSRKWLPWFHPLPSHISLTLLITIVTIRFQVDRFPVPYRFFSHFLDKWKGKSSSFSHSDYHCVKSVRIRSYSGPYFPAFGLNTERYKVSLRIQSECGKIRTRITRDTDTFHILYILALLQRLKTSSKPFYNFDKMAI